MFAVAGNKGQGRSEKDNDPYDEVNPGRMGVLSDRGEDHGQEGHENAMDHAGR